MTNKMPLIGRKYRLIENHAWIVEVTDLITVESNIWGDEVLGVKSERGGIPFVDSIGFFEKNYEELEDNLQEKKEVSEVERALEELKNQIVSFRLNFDMDYKPMRYLPDAAQNLINALETEKKPFFKVREEGQFEGLPPSAEALVRYDMSKPKPEIDMKEECVEPVSIWNLTRDLKDRCYFSSYQIWLYEIFINSFEQMQKDIEEIKRK